MSTQAFDPHKHAFAEISRFSEKDFRIIWRGPKGMFSSNVTYPSQAAATSMAKSCGAKKIA